MHYHVAFHMPKGEDRMVVAEVLDFPGAMSQGVDLPDARAMVTSALEELAEALLEEGRPLPRPASGIPESDADFVELIPLSVTAGATKPVLAPH